MAAATSDLQLVEWSVPTFHPAYIGRDKRKFEGLVLKVDMARLLKLARREWKPRWDRSRYIIGPSLKTVLRVLKAMAKKGRRVSYDIETDGGHPYKCAVRCIAFHDGQTTICVPFLYRDGTWTEKKWAWDEDDGEHAVCVNPNCKHGANGKPVAGNVAYWFGWRYGGKYRQPRCYMCRAGKWPNENKRGVEKKANWLPWWTPDQEERVYEGMQEVFDVCMLETQNGQYDRQCLELRDTTAVPTEVKRRSKVRRLAKRLEIPSANKPGNFDSIIAHHIVTSFFPHNLNFIGSTETEVPYYKTTEEGDAWSASSDYELWEYACDDVVVQYTACTNLREEIKLRKEDVALYEHDSWYEEQAQRWKRVGFPVDWRAVELFREEYGSKQEKALASMRELLEKELLKSEKSAKKHEQLEELLSVLQEKLSKGNKGSFKKDHDEAEYDEADADEAAAIFNPASLAQLRLLLRHLGVPLTQQTATGDLSTKKDFLLTARKELVARGEKGPALAFLDFLFAWRECAKMKSTYLYPDLIAHGKDEHGKLWCSCEEHVNDPFHVRVHGTFNIHVVPTGRLCLADWTLVRTRNRGWVRARDVLAGDEVWTHLSRWRPVTRVFFNGRRDVVDIKLQNGQVLTSTIDHKFFDGTEWVTAGAIREHLEKMAGGKIESGGGSSTIQKPQLAYKGEHRRDLEGHVRDSGRSPQIGDADRRNQGPFSSTLLGLEVRPEESTLGKAGRKGTSLEGTLRGRLWILDDSLQGPSSLCPSRCDDEAPRRLQIAAGHGCTSHQRGQEGQHTGQLGSSHGQGAQANSLPPGEGFTRCDVEAVDVGRCAETVDLEVEGDHSFQVEGGFFSHNSGSDPNLTNQPGEIRGMFIAAWLHYLVTGDWSALEMRLNGLVTGDSAMIQMFKEFDAGKGLKPHIVNASRIFDLPLEKDLEKKNPGCYRAAKVFAYLLGYGGGAKSCYEKMLDEMPDMKWDAFLICFDRYKKSYPQFFKDQRDIVLKGIQQGYLDEVISGRRIYYFEGARGSEEGSPEAESMQNMRFQGGGATIVGRANRRMVTRVLEPMRAEGENIEQHVQVHDELLFGVPKKRCSTFVPVFKRVCEEPVDKQHSDWYLPVEVHVCEPLAPNAPSRWKPCFVSCKACGKMARAEYAKDGVQDDVTIWDVVCEKNEKCVHHEKPFQLRIPHGPPEILQ
ncbi:MAG: hypothetical protein EPN91_08220 [Salinibacterium sp.]|nr:MAG: hypothetical protein EPN91_08220 [Salinibacterium sp.]